MNYKRIKVEDLPATYTDVKLTVDQYIAYKEQKYLDAQIALKAKTTVRWLKGWKKLHQIERVIAGIKKERLLERRSMIN
ncbi:hypothetical protein JMA_27250 [Jeotgalibacillus malaysiensis]|uniref:Uncharacterized protein n=1 Tax=Jeotgalibacillus malaysiensis TaxID=1508404 RepID=A0A0B5ATJ0_9BACL|nr:hypothetical protein [Jeotgalibacillus malaysiensis]AJD92042.1 hypothetical protein JMA_27250 [Jeotgalibacillus malaysiensis]